MPPLILQEEKIMKKIDEMTMSELSVFLCKIAGPAENIFSDAAVNEVFDDVAKMLKDKATVENAFSVFCARLVPVMMGKHEADTFAILAAMEGVSVDEIKEKNGFDVMRTMFKAFMIDRDIQTIFRPMQKVRGK